MQFAADVQRALPFTLEGAAAPLSPGASQTAKQVRPGPYLFTSSCDAVIALGRDPTARDFYVPAGASLTLVLTRVGEVRASALGTSSGIATLTPLLPLGAQ